MRGIQTEVRHLVCMRYKPVDPQELQATVERYEEGQVVPPQHNDAEHGRRYAELRQKAPELLAKLCMGETREGMGFCG